MDKSKPGNINNPLLSSPDGENDEDSFEEIEQRLLARLQDDNQDRKRVLRQLAAHYADHRRCDQALERMRELIALESDPEAKAKHLLATGSIAEMKKDYPGAVEYYREALALKPTDAFVLYFVLNNLAFSLNQLGDFIQGEKYCRKAIEINGSVCNAHKNLGLALVGQGRYAEGAECFVTATTVNPRDARSLQHLKDLLEQQPALAFDMREDLQACERAVKLAAQMRNVG
jgi:tetratricopeptide (TPR) repeat protein